MSSILVNGLNKYFSSDISVSHRTLTGFVRETRSGAFDQNQFGLRRLLSLSVRELNERQWVFFRYAILEIVHCKYAYQSVIKDLNDAGAELSNQYRDCLEGLVKNVVDLREQYISAATRAVLSTSEFDLEIKVLKARLGGEGKLELEIDGIINEKRAAKENEIREECSQNITASLGEIANEGQIVSRILIDTTEFKLRSL